MYFFKTQKGKNWNIKNMEANSNQNLGLVTLEYVETCIQVWSYRFLFISIVCIPLEKTITALSDLIYIEPSCGPQREGWHFGRTHFTLRAVGLKSLVLELCFQLYRCFMSYLICRERTCRQTTTRWP